MKTKLIQCGVVLGSLAGTLLIINLFVNLSADFFTVPILLILAGVTGAYAYGAATFMDIKGIHFFTKVRRIR